MLSYCRTLFDISAKEDGLVGLPLLRDVEEVIRTWSHERGFPESPDILDDPEGSGGGSRTWERDGSRLRLSGGDLGEQGHFWLRWYVDGDGGSNPGRYMGFRLATEGNSVQADVEVRVENREAGHFDQEMREVFATLLSRYGCSVLGTRLSLDPVWVREDEVESFWRRLSSPERCLPIVVVSEARGGGMPVDGNDLQQDLIGLAEVACCPDRVAWMLGWHSWKLLCYAGQVRVYAPHLSVDDDETRHRVWSPGDVSALDYAAFLQSLRDECAQRIHYPDGRDALRVFSRVRGRVRDRIRSELSRENQQAFDEWAEEVSAKDAEIKRWQDAHKSVQEENWRLGSQLDYWRGRARTLEGKLSSDPSRLSAGYAVTEVADTGETLSSVRTVADVVAMTESWQFVRVFERVAGDCAGMSVADGRLFYEELRKLEDCGLARSAGNLGMSEEDWMLGRGIHFAAGESQATMNKFGSQRQFRDDNGEEVEMQAHIRVGRSLRIHLLWSNAESRWLVGYFGQHLETSTG